MDCDEVRDAIGAYALGALDAGERELVERHLETCPGCRADAERAAAATAMVALAAPLHPAPAGLHSRLMRQIEEQERGEPEGALRRLVVDPPTEGSPRPRRQSGPSTGLGHRVLVWLQPLAASVAILLLLGAGVWIMRMQTQINRLQARSQTLQRQVADFGGQRAALMLLASEGTIRYDMQPSNPDTGVTGAVIWNPDQHACSVFASGLPPLAPGQSYHVWLVGNHHSWDSGTLTASTEGVVEKTIDLSSMSSDSGYQIVVSMQQQHQDSGSAWQPLLKAWVGIQ